MERSGSLGLGFAEFVLQSQNSIDARVDIVVDNCAICRNHIMDLCTHRAFNSRLIVTLLLGIECQANAASATSEECMAAFFFFFDMVLISHIMTRHRCMGYLQPCFPLSLHLSLAEDSPSLPSWCDLFSCCVSCARESHSTSLQTIVIGSSKSMAANGLLFFLFM